MWAAARLCSSRAACACSGCNKHDCDTAVTAVTALLSSCAPPPPQAQAWGRLSKEEFIKEMTAVENEVREIPVLYPMSIAISISYDYIYMDYIYCYIYNLYPISISVSISISMSDSTSIAVSIFIPHVLACGE